MVTALANFTMNAKRQRREDARQEQEALADLLVVADRLTGIGRRLTSSIESLERDSGVALSFLTRQASKEDPPSKLLKGTGQASDEDRATRLLKGRRLKPGQNLVTVSGSSREMWDLLVDDVCAHVKLINSLVLDYTAQLPPLIQALRRLSARTDVPAEVIARYTDERATVLQKKADAFQALGPRASLAKAQAAFLEMCNEARNFVAALNKAMVRVRQQVG